MRESFHYFVLAAMLSFVSGCSWVGAGASEIDEGRARKLADKTFREFCAEEGEPCADFFFAAARPAKDLAFRWSFDYVDQQVDPWKLVTVSVDKFGAASAEYRTTAAGVLP